MPGYELIGKEELKEVSQLFKKSKTLIKDNVFIGSNSSLVAPVKIEKNSIVGAGSVITKNVKKKTIALTRAPQLEIKNYKRKKK
mgnify:CR=1 FL=1